MARTIAYWTATAIVALGLLGSLSYLTGSEQVVSGFAKAGYPQHLRIVLGIAKPAAAIVLLVPGLALCKEWAYAASRFRGSWPSSRRRRRASQSPSASCRSSSSRSLSSRM